MSEKQHRQATLQQVLRDTAVHSQAELQDALRQRNIRVSQATLSRDIKELGLIKTPQVDQRYRYVVPEEQVLQRRYDRLQLAFAHFVRSYDHAGNLMVVKTSPGTAHAVAVDLDAMQWEDVLGTVAGDDTILVVTRSVHAVKRLHERFQQLLTTQTEGFVHS
jgi:transcriptional regulator of arginine metabolism